MNLKLFVWRNVLRDYNPGIMFALAADADEARRLIWESDPDVDRYEPDDLLTEPEVFTTPVGFAIWGGS